MTDIATIGADFFRAHEGATIALADSEGNVVLTPTLLRVRERPEATMAGAPRQAFSLILAAPLPCAVVSGTFTLGHPEFGAVGPVYLERVMSSPDQAWFGIYFN